MQPTNAPEKLWPQDDPSVLQDVSYLEGDYKSNLTTPGLEASFDASIESGFTYKTFEKIENSIADKVIPNNKFLTPEEAQQSPDYRPGIDVSHGISEYMLKRAAQTYDRKQEQAFAISQMPDGVGSAIGRGSMDILGSALDPATLATSVLAPETIGIRGAAFLAKASTPATKLAIQIGTGLGEGAVIGAPSVAADLMDENKYLPEQDKGAHAIADLAGFMAFGGVIRGLTGVKVPISKQAAEYANQVSVHQISEGFFPNTDLIVQQGYYEARQLPEQELEPNTKGLINDVSKLTDREYDEHIYNTIIAPLEKEEIPNIKNGNAKSLMKILNDDRQAINRLRSQENINLITSDLRKVNPNAKYKDILTKAKAIIKRDVDVYKEEMSHIQAQLNEMKELSKSRLLVRNLKRNLNGTTILKNVKEAVPKQPYAIMAEDALKSSVKDIDKNLQEFQQYLPQDILQDKEHKNTSQIISEVLNDKENLPDNLSTSSKQYSQMKLPLYLKRAIDIMHKRAEYRTPDETKHLLSTLFDDEDKIIKRDSRGVEKQLNSNITDAERIYLENELKALKSRAEDLKKAKDKYGDFWRTKQAFDASLLKKYDILQTLKRNDVYKLMLKGTGQPVTKSQLEDGVASALSADNELPLNANEDAIFKASSESVPEDFNQAYDAALKTFNAIDKDETASVREEMNLIQNATNVITKALEQAAKCLGGVK